MTEDVRATLWREMRERGITGPEMFAARYGRRLCDLTPAVRRVPLASLAASESTDGHANRKEQPQ